MKSNECWEVFVICSGVAVVVFLLSVFLKTVIGS